MQWFDHQTPGTANGAVANTRLGGRQGVPRLIGNFKKASHYSL
jgi:hypothetical protein